MDHLGSPAAGESVIVDQARTISRHYQENGKVGRVAKGVVLNVIQSSNYAATTCQPATARDSDRRGR